MTDLIDLLERFNRKERFFLIRQAVGKNEFPLSDVFRKELECKIGVQIPSNAFVAMDYHLDWVAASLRAYQQQIPIDKIACEVFPNSGEKKVVMGNQQDIDLLIAFHGIDCIYHLVFLEAKGYGAWDSKQMRGKADRLKKLFGDDGSQSNVKSHFCLTSPRQPNKNLKNDNWPEWMRQDGTPHWLELCLPSERRRVTRYDPDKEKPSEEGKFFKIVKA